MIVWQQGLGYDVGKVDSIFGPKTLSAVKSYQKAQGLSVDGIVGKNTWNLISSPQSQPAAKSGGSAAGAPPISDTSNIKAPDRPYTPIFLNDWSGDLVLMINSVEQVWIRRKLTVGTVGTDKAIAEIPPKYMPDTSVVLLGNTGQIPFVAEAGFIISTDGPCLYLWPPLSAYVKTSDTVYINDIYQI